MANTLESPGILAFTFLRAEDEPWLNQCFVPPPHFEHVLGMKSVLILGESGTGKTALCRKLAAQGQQGSGPTYLIVRWRPTPPQEHPSIQWVQAETQRLLNAIVGSVLHLLATHPEHYVEAPEWVKARWAWFVHRYTLGDPHVRWGKFTSPSYPGASLIRHLLSLSPPEVLHEQAPMNQVIGELSTALEFVGIRGIWTLMDGLEGWSEIEPEQLTEGLRAFFSTLSLFEHPSLAFKICAPAHMEPYLAPSGAIIRRRVSIFHLRWDASRLKRLVERRLAFAFGRLTFPLEDLCSAPGLMQWLERLGGSPREWLDQVAVLVEYYERHPDKAPIDEKTWKKLRKKRPPHFYLDDKHKEVVVGGRHITLDALPTKAYEMLRYLYQRRGEVVRREEIYYALYYGLDKVPPRTDANYIHPSVYRGQIDTLLWRLRKAIEPDPKDPVLLVTRSRQGIMLNVRV